MENTKQERILEIFFRGLRGEALSVQKLAEEYQVSTKSIGRDVNDLKMFLSNRRDLVGSTELQYSSQEKCYRLCIDGFLTNQQLFSLVKVMIGVRAFSREELMSLIESLKRFTTAQDRPKLNELIRRELYHYTEIKHDCESVQEVLWKLANSITQRREISIEYYRMDRAWRTYRLRPASLMFADHYFYLIAYVVGRDPDKPIYFRVDRIKRITEHRKLFTTDAAHEFDEGLLRKRSLFMWPGQLRTIRFEFTGPSVQAVLDKLPTARVIEREGNKYLLEAEVYGDGIKMWLLSQGKWVKVVSPEEFVEEMRKEVSALGEIYRG